MLKPVATFQSVRLKDNLLQLLINKGDTNKYFRDYFHSKSKNCQLKSLTFHAIFALGPAQVNHASSTNRWMESRRPNRRSFCYLLKLLT